MVRLFDQRRGGTSSNDRVPDTCYNAWAAGEKEHPLAARAADIRIQRALIIIQFGPKMGRGRGRLREDIVRDVPPTEPEFMLLSHAGHNEGSCAAVFGWSGARHLSLGVTKIVTF